MELGLEGFGSIDEDPGQWPQVETAVNLRVEASDDFAAERVERGEQRSRLGASTPGTECSVVAIGVAGILILPASPPQAAYDCTA